MYRNLSVFFQRIVQKRTAQKNRTHALLAWLSLLTNFAIVQIAFAQNAASGPHINVELISEHQSLAPGQTQYLAVHMQPEEHWHTYWRNPGDSGEPPTIEWQTSANIAFGEIQWPLPEPIPVAHLVNYGYSDNHLLMVPITISDTTDVGSTIQINANLSWLVCKEDCIPGWATLSVTLPVSKRPLVNSTHATLFSEARRRLPSGEVKQAIFELGDEHIALALDLDSNVDFANLNHSTNEVWYVFPFRSDVASHNAEQQQILTENELTFLLTKSDYFSGKLESLNALVSNGVRGFYVSAKASVENINSSDELSTNNPRLTIAEIGIYAGMALLGGLILNIMPCVLPILSIKALSFQNTDVQNNSNVAHKYAYLLGVFACFNVFALIIIALKFSGTELGWGFHLQSPMVIATLAFLFTFLGLLLLDVMQLGSSLTGVGSNLITGNNAKSHFFTGALAVVVASPCTAPFMAAALGVALTQPPLISLIIFNALALGFALPMTMMFLSLKVQTLLPKPGPWMQTFKHSLAFPMFATTAWLCWVYLGQTNAVAQFILLCALVGFAFFVWLLSIASKGSKSKFSTAIASIGLICCCVIVFTQSPDNAPSSELSAKNTIVEQYDPNRLLELQNDNRVVFVNMTADWCITCKVNEHVALKNEQVTSFIEQHEVTYMVGDWTNKNDTIFKFLKQYKRAGVPLYVVFGGKQHVQILPQVLTPEIVVNSLNKALEERSNES